MVGKKTLTEIKVRRCQMIYLPTSAYKHCREKGMNCKAIEAYNYECAGV